MRRQIKPVQSGRKSTNPRWISTHTPSDLLQSRRLRTTRSVLILFALGTLGLMLIQYFEHSRSAPTPLEYLGGSALQDADTRTEQDNPLSLPPEFVCLGSSEDASLIGYETSCSSYEAIALIERSMHSQGWTSLSSDKIGVLTFSRDSHAEDDAVQTSRFTYALITCVSYEQGASIVVEMM